MARTIFLVSSVLLATVACDRAPGSGAAAMAADAALAPSPANTDASTAATKPTSAAPASTWDGSMPERPVPKTSPTVGSGMPAETQMKAIAYMAAMGEPRFDEPNADPDYAAALAERLKPIVLGLDKGAPEDKAKLDHVEVIANGRKIDLLMAAGCTSETPMRAVVTRAGTPLATLAAHGVLVVRCNDARTQCLQSTRDPSDVLCTTAPRHK